MIGIFSKVLNILDRIFVNVKKLEYSCTLLIESSRRYAICLEYSNMMSNNHYLWNKCGHHMIPLQWWTSRQSTWIDYLVDLCEPQHYLSRTSRCRDYPSKPWTNCMHILEDIPKRYTELDMVQAIIPNVTTRNICERSLRQASSL
mgnify:CR=1 FL=1